MAWYDDIYAWGEKKFEDVTDWADDVSGGWLDEELDMQREKILDTGQEQENKYQESVITSRPGGGFLESAGKYAPIAGVGIALIALLRG